MCWTQILDRPWHSYAHVQSVGKQEAHEKNDKKTVLRAFIGLKNCEWNSMPALCTTYDLCVA